MTIKWILPVMAKRVDEPDIWLRPSVALICLTQGCRRFGNRVTILPKLTMPGVLEIPTYICADCLTELARVTEEEIHG
jgi:hypothetical protein